MTRSLRVLFLALLAAIGGCGRIPPTSPVAACPPVAKNLAYQDSLAAVYACNVEVR